MKTQLRKLTGHNEGDSKRQVHSTDCPHKNNWKDLILIT